MMTGRPWSISKADYRVPIPNLKLPTGKIETDSYLLASSSLSGITGEVMHLLYNIRTRDWDETKRNVEVLTVILERWKMDLPKHLDIEVASTDQSFIRQVCRLCVDLKGISQKKH